MIPLLILAGLLAGAVCFIVGYSFGYWHRPKPAKVIRREIICADEIGEAITPPMGVL